MGVPPSEVGYTSAMPRREDHEVHKDMWGIGRKGEKNAVLRVQNCFFYIFLRTNCRNIAKRTSQKIFQKTSILNKYDCCADPPIYLCIYCTSHSVIHFAASHFKSNRHWRIRYPRLCIHRVLLPVRRPARVTDIVVLFSSSINIPV